LGGSYNGLLYLVPNQTDSNPMLPTKISTHMTISKQRKERMVLQKLEGNTQKVWTCKIGYAADADVPEGGDAPMRKAVEQIFRTVTGHDADFCFSGWGGELTEIEEQIVWEDKHAKM
jgi:hypothetical protein